ncbi:hypothetical protein EVJ32_09445 [Exiguobacterium sp. SH5S4]|uniref:hypothetical protein n=1 Tax=Exiguobacterium sp. SH5S4 TaxID=2510961 RepID=UPI00103E2ABA|nr:hypothetical protein [Exiguobacterium sp. SH5S4]TCI25538.1 hypothetical protein EVJ32_09445 [Exiguobacterium sp. SH5S4]
MKNMNFNPETALHDFEDWLIDTKLREGIRGVDFLATMIVPRTERHEDHYRFMGRKFKVVHPHERIESMLYASLNHRYDHDSFHRKWGFNLGIIQEHALWSLQEIKTSDLDRYIDALEIVDSIIKQTISEDEWP